MDYGAYYVQSIVVYVLCVVQVETELYYTQHIHHYGLDIVCCHTTA